jgi:hypothetical protein
MTFHGDPASSVARGRNLVTTTCKGVDVIEDGSYDAFIVDATADGEDLRLELTIIAGDHKGEVVTVRARGLGIDELDAIGIPATVTVEAGAPSVAIDDV